MVLCAIFPFSYVCSCCFSKEIPFFSNINFLILFISSFPICFFFFSFFFDFFTYCFAFFCHFLFATLLRLFCLLSSFSLSPFLLAFTFFFFFFQNFLFSFFRFWLSTYLRCLILLHIIYGNLQWVVKG